MVRTRAGEFLVLQLSERGGSPRTSRSCRLKMPRTLSNKAYGRLPACLFPPAWEFASITKRSASNSSIYRCFRAPFRVPESVTLCQWGLGAQRPQPCPASRGQPLLSYTHRSPPSAQTALAASLAAMQLSTEAQPGALGQHQGSLPTQQALPLPGTDFYNDVFCLKVGGCGGVVWRAGRRACGALATGHPGILQA